jgi:hypothetical protein
MTLHFKIICRDCKKVIAQCLCMGENKIIGYDLCEKCANKHTTVDPTPKTDGEVKP